MLSAFSWHAWSEVVLHDDYLKESLGVGAHGGPLDQEGGQPSSVLLPFSE
jgi:hypothetical protein